MPNTYKNKVVYNGTTLIDLTSDTATAADVASGKYFHLATGERVQGTASGGGGGGDAYTRTVVVPEQTLTPDSNRAAVFSATDSFIDGEYYVVTFDNTEYLATAGTLWSNNVVLGDAQVVWVTSDVTYPFAAITVGTDRECYFTNTNQHTIKVEHLEFVDGPLDLIAKSVTANGTYDAEDDGADGYSSVTVNVPTGTDTSHDTVDAAHLLSGYTAHDSTGTAIVGTYVPSGDSMNVQVAQSTTRVASTTYTKTASLTCAKSGTYDVYWDCFRSSTSGTSGSQLYIGGSEYGNPNTTFASNVHAQTNHLTGVTLAANQEVAVYVRSRGSNYYAYCGQLTIVQTA